MPKAVNPGDRVGSLICIERAGRSASGSYNWKWLCDCGSYRVAPVAAVKQMQREHKQKTRSVPACCIECGRRGMGLSKRKVHVLDLPKVVEEVVAHGGVKAGRKFGISSVQASKISRMKGTEFLEGAFGREFVSSFTWVFDVAVPVCEETMTRFGSPRGMFRMLQPSPILSRRPRKVLLSHDVELCRRFKAGEDLRPGTAAEVLCALSEASLVAPLRSHIGSLATRLAKVVVEFDDPIVVEEYKGQHREMMADFRRKMRQDWRVLKGDT